VRSRKIISALAFVGAFAAVPGAGVAHAAVSGTGVAHVAAGGGGVECRGGFVEATLGPALTWQTKTSRLTGEGDVGQCQSTEDSKVTGGTFTFAATGQGECPTGINANGTGTITWNTGENSTISGTAVVNADQIGVSGIHVTKGKFAGESGQFAGPITYLPWYNCLTPGGLAYGRGIINTGFVH
jgi:hypothetical protein